MALTKYMYILHTQCHDFLKIYGVSLTTLIKRSEKRSEICVKVGKCFQDGDNSMFVEISDGNWLFDNLA